jgi:2'-5' RNA ligase
MIRLFIAFPLQKEVGEQLGEIIALLRNQGGRVRWVAPENIHLTARFLGDTNESLVERLTALIDDTAANYNPVDSLIDRLGAFPNLPRPRVIWAGLRDNTEVLVKIARELELSVRKLRFKPEKRGFKAHLTLGRVKNPSGVGNLTAYMQYFKLEEIPLKFDRLTLFKSTLTPQGPIYDRLHEAILGESEM